MDPGIVATRPLYNSNDVLTGINNITEEDAYRMAKDEGYTFDGYGNIGTLTEEELDFIASEPPNVSLRAWKTYREMTEKDLMNEFPEVKEIINNPTYSDYFYYATHGTIPEKINSDIKLKRWREYEDLSDVSKTLMDQIYGDQYGYAYNFGHPLEDYIVAFDQNMDDENVIRSLAERAGFSIPEDQPAAETFIQKLYDHSNNVEIYGPQESRRADIYPDTQEIIDMTEDEYEKYISKYNPRLNPIVSEDFEQEELIYPQGLRNPWHSRSLYSSRTENLDDLYNR